MAGLITALSLSPIRSRGMRRYQGASKALREIPSRRHWELIKQGTPADAVAARCSALLTKFFMEYILPFLVMTWLMNAISGR